MGEIGVADADGQKILVSVRLRPLNEKESTRNDVSDWECINDDTVIYRNSLSVSERSMYPTAYKFDRVFGPGCSTRQVYGEGAKEVALSVVSGINSSVFAYGQTSSGKTYTMSGITEYTVADIYDYVEKHKEREFTLKFSAMEIYNESVRDLLSTDTTPLRLLDDPERGTVVERLTEETIRDWNHFKELLSVCEAQRQIGETSLNEASSRSHQILRLTIESSARELLGHYKSSTLASTVNFVDLAGSERASQSLSAGMRLKEGCHINRSLLTLGTVIRKLSKGRNGHIPFRDSKLTRILQSSLGGNARTAIICTMSPARSHVEQSRNTLLFASCAKEVTTNAQVNVVVSDKTLVKQLQRELTRLESELKNTRPDSVAPDSMAVLIEKDLQIEKLMKEVAELTQQLDLAQSQVENLLQSSEGDRASTPDQDHHYPKLRVRDSFRSDNSVSYSLISEDPPSLDLGARSFDASQCSDERSSRSSEATFIQFPEFEESFIPENLSPEDSIKNSNFVGNGLHEKKDAKERANQNFDGHWKEVQCVEVEEPTTKQYSNPKMSESRPCRFEESNRPSLDMETDTLGLAMIVNEERADQELKSPPLKEQKELNGLHSTFIIPSPEKPSPWLLKEGLSESRRFFIRSRSCRARLMNNSPNSHFEKVEDNESTPSIGFEKDFPGRPEGFQKKLPVLKYDLDVKSLSRNVSENSMSSCAVNELKEGSFGTSPDWRTASVGNSDAGLMCMADDLVSEVKDVGLDAMQDDVSTKNVKDVGLDPIQEDAENASKWPLEFKRKQSRIIELWHACDVSLVHRTYFFLLFNGDPADSFYMEVESRRISLLKNTLSRGNSTIVHGQVITSTSSKKALIQERQMLARHMQKRLTREERENLFLKWGIPLNGTNRRLQLVHRLWTKPTDMDHIIESATLVAKLVGFDEQEQALKEMFGLLNFTPTHPSRRKPSIWKLSGLSFL
ncbi:kinesin protein [Salix suchowensis]|nr:kinesin protein [Salix suchowensis]